MIVGYRFSGCYALDYVSYVCIVGKKEKTRTDVRVKKRDEKKKRRTKETQSDLVEKRTFRRHVPPLKMWRIGGNRHHNVHIARTYTRVRSTVLT